ETVQSAAPLYDGTNPYRQVPFQFSLHVQAQPGGPLKHTSFLHKKNTDPREAFTKALVKACGTKGSVVVYNMEFESQRNNELGRDFPAYKAQLSAINARMIDQYLPFKNRWLYSP